MTLQIKTKQHGSNKIASDILAYQILKVVNLTENDVMKTKLKKKFRDKLRGTSLNSTLFLPG